MERREQFLNIVSSVSADAEIAAKYAAHLEELFDVIVPEKIGADFCKALENNNYEAAVKLARTTSAKNPISQSPSFRVKAHTAFRQPKTA